MRVKKTAEGNFVIEDEPMVLDGEAAAQFLQALQQRDEQGDDTERRRFLEECDRAYRASVERRSRR